MINPLVSIIVPVYNVDKYLNRCLDSIIMQTYKNLEIIIVDDGSTDNSGIISDFYAAHDMRIQVFHQKNHGQADARNMAFKQSSGKFIAYIDSDDYIDKNYVKNLIDVALKNEVDIVQCFMRKFKTEKSTNKNISFENVHEEIYSSSKALEEFCYQRKFYASPCCKIIRREIMEDILFPTDIGYEDMAIMFRILGKANRIALFPQVMYYYRQHSNSTMHEKFSDKKIDRINVAEKLKVYIETYFPENITAMKSRYLLANLQLTMELPMDGKHKALRKVIKKNIKKFRKDVICDKRAKVTVRIMALASYGGIFFLMFLGRVYKKTHGR